MADAAESPSTLKSEPSSEPSSHLLGQIFPKSPTCCSSSSKSYLLHEDVALGKNADLVTPKCSPPPEDIVPSSPPPDSSSSTSFSLVESNSRPCGVELVCTARTNKKADPDDLVALAMQVQQADERTRSVAGSKLSVIAEQIQFLQQQAAKILEETRLNAELNHAACNMVKKPGTVYHLYQRGVGSLLSSRVSGILQARIRHVLDADRQKERAELGRSRRDEYSQGASPRRSGQCRQSCAGIIEILR